MSTHRDVSRRPEPWDIVDGGAAQSVTPPAFEIADGPPSALMVETVAIPVMCSVEGVELGTDVADSDFGWDLLSELRAAGHSGKVGEILRLPRADGVLLLVGVGKGKTTEVRRAAAATVRAAERSETLALLLPTLGTEDVLAAVVEGVVLARPTMSLRSKKSPRLIRVLIVGSSITGEALQRAVAIAHAGALARALATVPSNIKSPIWMADQAIAHGRRAGLEVEVWDEPRLVAEGFGGVLSVGSGSATSPRFVQLRYHPPRTNRETPHVVLVGKGITFDTGGLSIKSAEGMATMKRDMTGAGVVLAVMSALERTGCEVRVTGLLPLAENAVGAAAMRPGDVIVHYGGRTSEVTNTDAEGRLVLADALAYAAENLDPTVLVDIATLTGAAKVALGIHLGGLFATSDSLADAFIQAGVASGEPLWRLPLTDVYMDRLNSAVADADNAGGGPGALTAALFLKPFTGGLPWVHLDIAPIGDSVEDAFEYAKGPTGFGARLLLRWLRDYQVA